MNDAEVREHVLDEAKKCVLKDRNSTYGKPEDNFRQIAKLWEAYDEIRKPGPETPTDVAIKMTLMKIARLAHNPTHKDSWIDGIGYLACGAGIEIAEDLISREPNTDATYRSGSALGKGSILPEALIQLEIARLKGLCQIPSTSSASQS